MLVMPAGMSKRYLTEKPSIIELLTDPAEGTELEAIKVVFLLADRDAASLGDPFSENLLEIKEQSLTGRRIELTHIEQNRPAGFARRPVARGSAVRIFAAASGEGMMIASSSRHCSARSPPHIAPSADRAAAGAVG